jgi:hypothetical protein
MYFLKCNHCGHLNEIKSEYLVFCSNCKKKLENSYSDWQRRNPEKTFDDYKQLICISEIDIQRSNIKPKSNRKAITISFVSLAAFAVGFAIFYIIGHIGGDKLFTMFNNQVYDKVMVEMASKISKQCPIMVDNVTRLDNVIAMPNNVFQYNYTIVATVKDSIKVDEAKSIMEPRIINNVKTEPSLKYMRDHKTTINYNYKDKVGVFLFTISVKPEQYQ